MRGIIIDDEMRIECRRHVGLDMLEEAEKLLMTMARATLREDPAIGDVERGKKGRRTVSDVIVGDALNIAKPERQHRLHAFQRLNLALFVDAQHDGVIGWIEVEADDVPACRQTRIGGKLEALGAMRLNAGQGKHARHGALRQASRLGGGSHRPMGPRQWFRLEDRAKKVGDRCFVMGAGSTRPGLAVSPAIP